MRARRRRSPQSQALLNHQPPKQVTGGWLEDAEKQKRNELIKAEHAAGIGYHTIAKRYGLSPSRVRYIVIGNLSYAPKIRSVSHTKAQAAPLPIANGASADDFLQLLKDADISQRRFARLLGYSEHTVNMYAVGKIPMPMHIRRYLELLVYVRKHMKMVRSLRLEDQGKFDE